MQHLILGLTPIRLAKHLFAKQWRINLNNARHSAATPWSPLFYSTASTEPTIKFTTIKHYTPEEDQRILDMVSRHCTWSAISIAIPGTTAKGVRHRYGRHLRPADHPSASRARKYSEEENKLIVEMRANGITWRKIGERLGVAYTAANVQGLKLLKEERWQILYRKLRDPTATRGCGPGRPFTREDDKQIIALRNQRVPWREMARITGRTVGTLHVRWQEWLDDGPLATRNRLRKGEASYDQNKEVTQKQHELLECLMKQRITMYNMALALDWVTLGQVKRLIAVHRRWAHHGNVPVHRKRWSEREDQTLRSAIERSASGQKLCDSLPGRTLQSIISRCNLLQLKKPRMVHRGSSAISRRWAAALDEKISRLRAEGKTCREIGQAVDRSTAAVSQRFSHLRHRSKVELISTGNT